MKLNATILQAESGYTLVELMAASLISLLLGSTVFALYGATTQWVAPWQRGVQLENCLHLISQRISSDLIYAEQWGAEEDGLWTLAYRTEKRVHYTLQDSVLSRNGRRMHDRSLAMVTFQMEPVVSSHTRRARLYIALQNRERTASATTTVMLRQPRPWTPLP